MRRALTLLLFALVTLSVVAQSRVEQILNEIANPKSRYVVVIAHRSDWRHYPENSLAAMEGAIAMGVDMVEIDVQRTADGVLVCCHDSSVDRTTTGKGKIKELTADYISTLKLKTEQGITDYGVPTLAQALELCKGRVLINIDKGYNYYDQILQMLVERDMVNQVLIKSSKDASVVAEKFAPYTTNMLYMPVINYNAKSWGKHADIFNSYITSNLDVVAYEICWDGTLEGERKIFKKVLDSGARLWVNTLWDSLCGGKGHSFKDDNALDGNADKIYGTLLKHGVTMIQSDRPQLLLDYLESKGRHTLK
ncbi:MAG: glycerophosphodiester phosphodiesterase family protein [Alistipes sp.]|nr:glycerophosphodiester phosphodiesterase family protein [Alistipes sp.]